MTARFVTLGCRLNQAEESELAGVFSSRGWEVLFGAGPAEAVVVRSCAVTRKAERTTLQTLRSLKRSCGCATLPVVAVTGCATAALPRGILEEAGADFVVKKGMEWSLPERIEAFILSGARPRTAAEKAPGGEFPAETDANPLLSTRLARAEPDCAIHTFAPAFRYERALLKVQDGCDFMCSYCIVPFTRGPSVSRPFGELLDAAQAIFRRGYRHLAVTGCNLACYADAGRGLPELLSALCTLAAEDGGIVSIGSLEPAICDDGIVEAMLEFPNFQRAIHLPVQSGDTDVLRRAGRRYGETELRRVLSLYRSKVDGLFLGGDFITGLPGESETAFQRTCAIVEDFAFDSVHVFPFSPRQGTAAADEDAPPMATARERAARLRAIATRNGSRLAHGEGGASSMASDSSR